MALEDDGAAGSAETTQQLHRQVTGIISPATLLSFAQRQTHGTLGDLDDSMGLLYHLTS